MLDNKSFWIGNMMFCLVLWVFVIFGVFYSFESHEVTIAWWAITLALVIGHTFELIISIPIGNNAGISLQKTIINTIIFGFTWWVPLKRGVFKQQ